MNYFISILIFIFGTLVLILFCIVVTIITLALISLLFKKINKFLTNKKE